MGPVATVGEVRLELGGPETGAGTVPERPVVVQDGGGRGPPIGPAEAGSR